jgi:hypothetical protein
MFDNYFVISASAPCHFDPQRQIYKAFALWITVRQLFSDITVSDITAEVDWLQAQVRFRPGFVRGAG